MRSRRTALVLLLGLATVAPRAETLSCPDLSAAVQVGSCPSEEELRYTFSGYCSANARLYDRDTVTCSDYKHYRRLKNTALWESGDGAFQAYLSCDLPAVAIGRAKATAIAVVNQGGIARVICTYGDRITFTHRARAECRVDGDGGCTENPAACKATCD